MAYEFMLHDGCPVHEQHGVGGAMRLRKTLTTLLVAKQWLTNEGKTPEEIERQPLSLPWPIETSEGPTATPTYAQLAETCERIAERHRMVCADCPLNLFGGTIGCHSSILYPISSDCERRLVERFDPPGGSYLLSEIRSSDFEEGTGLDAPREEGGFFESAKPFHKVAKDTEGTSVRFRLSLLLAYLNARGGISPRSAFHVCREFGFLEGPLDQIEAVLSWPPRPLSPEEGAVLEIAMREVRLVVHESPDDDVSMSRFHRFVRACWESARRGAVVVIDG